MLGFRNNSQWLDMSDFVVHFTKPVGSDATGYATMMKILSSQVLRAGNQPFGMGRDNFGVGELHCSVCFSEVPLGQLLARAALAPKAEDLAPVVAALSEEKLQKHFERLAKLTEKAPAEGKRALEGWFGPVTMTPKTENGETFYEAKGSIKLDPATLGDGRVVDKTSCGGAISDISRIKVAPGAPVVPWSCVLTRGRRGRAKLEPVGAGPNR